MLKMIKAADGVRSGSLVGGRKTEESGLPIQAAPFTAYRAVNLKRFFGRGKPQNRAALELVVAGIGHRARAFIGFRVSQGALLPSQFGPFASDKAVDFVRAG